MNSRGLGRAGQSPLPPNFRERTPPRAALSCMPRCARIVLPGIPHHITQRGNYRQRIFFRAEDYRLYLDLLTEAARHHGVTILGFCLMPNHVHVIAVPHEPRALGRLFRGVHGDYARAVHIRLARRGHLFQARFQSVPMDEEHFWAALVYVEQNPVRAGLVEECGAWPWSSAREHLGEASRRLVDLVAWRGRHTPESWKLRLELGLRNAALLERIREGTRLGRPLGSEEFLERIESEFRVAARVRRRTAAG